MFKVEIREFKHSTALYKRKFYETEKQFLKWFEHHKHRYDGCYTVTGFQMQENGEWHEYQPEGN